MVGVIINTTRPERKAKNFTFCKSHRITGSWGRLVTGQLSLRPRQSDSISRAALCPGAPITPPPG